MYTFPNTLTTTTAIPDGIGRVMRKGCYPLTADIANSNRKCADDTLAYLENWGYTSSERISAWQHHDSLDRDVIVNGHDNGATVVLVNPLAIIPAMIVDRVTGAVAPWGYIWEDDLV